MSMMGWEYGWRPYVPAAVRRANAVRQAAKMAKNGRKLAPVARLAGRQIARTFWGKAWCEQLESHSDYANRLPRGRTYLRNGSVVDLQIAAARVTAIVSGSRLYRIEIQIKKLDAAHWGRIKQQCSGKITSMMDLLQGRLAGGTMEIVTHRETGLFPKPSEISLDCSCPDWAGMCKHVAAALYGVGVRLDEDPSLLFRLRGVDHGELIVSAAEAVREPLSGSAPPALSDGDLAEVFGIELAAAPSSLPGGSKTVRAKSKPKNSKSGTKASAPLPAKLKKKKSRRRR